MQRRIRPADGAGRVPGDAGCGNRNRVAQADPAGVARRRARTHRRPFDDLYGYARLAEVEHGAQADGPGADHHYRLVLAARLASRWGAGAGWSCIGTGVFVVWAGLWARCRGVVAAGRGPVFG